MTVSLKSSRLFDAARRTIVMPAMAAMAACFLTAGTAAASAPARPSDVDLLYKVYIGGFHVVDLRLDIGFAPANYDVKANLKSSGMIGQMFPWTMQAYSQGAFAEGGTIVPLSAGQQNTWRGQERFIDLKFTDGIARVERVKPEPSADDRDAVPEGLRAGALDLTSAIMAIITRMQGDDACQGNIPVFDGRRRYDLMVEPDGADRLKPNRYSPFEGATVNCLIWIDKKAGFKRKDSSGWNDQDRRARVWMGRAFGDAPPVPVRLTFDTPFGALIAHLNRATLTSGDSRQSLSQAD